MKIALAAAPIPKGLSQGLLNLERLVRQAAQQEARIVCFPESYLPGYPGMGFDPEDQSPKKLAKGLERAKAIARQSSIAIILPMDGFVEGKLMNLVYVIDSSGDVQGFQTKNQLDPSEDDYWTAGTERQLFQIDDLTFGIVICHEGFRYPESVRWCARRGAQLVFHPHFGGSNITGETLTTFLSPQNPYYEKAMMMRALENGIFFASVNYSSKYPESASAVFAPDGTCLDYQPYGKEGVLVVDIDLHQATGIYAKRLGPDLYKD
jgi:predicted amidohydrolase